jgi:hypothetical protein
MYIFVVLDLHPFLKHHAPQAHLILSTFVEHKNRRISTSIRKGLDGSLYQ